MNIQAVLIVRDDKETSLLVGYFLLSKESSRRWCHSSACKMNARPESPCTENNTSSKFKSKLIFKGSSKLQN